MRTLAPRFRVEFVDRDNHWTRYTVPYGPPNILDRRHALLEAFSLVDDLTSQGWQLLILTEDLP